MNEVNDKVNSEFNMRFMLALDCYMHSVAQALLKDCREDIRLFGFEFAQKKWSKFIEGSLTGEGGACGLGGGGKPKARHPSVH